MIEQYIIFIINGTVTLIAVIVALLKKKGSAKNSVLEIIEKIPEYIREAEALFGRKTGEAKLNYALSRIQLECLKTNLDYNEDYYIKNIENVLNTPQKEFKNETTSNNKED